MPMYALLKLYSILLFSWFFFIRKYTKYISYYIININIIIFMEILCNKCQISYILSSNLFVIYHIDLFLQWYGITMVFLFP